MDKKAIRIITKSEADQEDDLKGLSPGDLLGMMWELAMNAWSFRMNIDVEPRLQRDVVVLNRGEG
ncbi:MAG: hypothetical protein RIR52_2618 [Acidobacteriota bacterium]|jgi:hypothetical protein